MITGFTEILFLAASAGWGLLNDSAVEFKHCTAAGSLDVSYF